MKKKIFFTVLIGMMVMFQSLSFGAELIIYGTGGVTINYQTGDILVCPKADPSKKCATLIIEGDEIKILESANQQHVISSTTSLSAGLVLNILTSHNNSSGERINGYELNNLNLKVTNP